MRVFNCDNCGYPVFFENVQCLHCGCKLGYLPDLFLVAALAAADGNAAPALFTRSSDAGAPDARRWRMCHNHDAYQACNFAVPMEDDNPLCISCRQTRLLPDLSQPENRQRWYRIEVAKRRLFYSLARLGLAAAAGQGPVPNPVYEFLADQPGTEPVMTGHADGVITLNIAEADDDERVRRRVALHEPYRTLLGHLRHESGHFYWDRLIRDQGRTESFRAVFGDESQDYAQALRAHYARTPGSAAWQDDHVSFYAASHPWEDWAETWAHYLHMVDLLETAWAYQTTVVVPGDAPDAGTRVGNPFSDPPLPFDALVRQWVPLTLMLNSLNRSLGQEDAYPFALPARVLDKLCHVHDVVAEAAHPVVAAQSEVGAAYTPPPTTQPPQ
ncbi:putative zinc-binding metallopeptidase [Ramlibacter sp. H39-3-26]|uniref:zinc-binding metallopeptidase family protein n=1 Tax=Curvibacter soli TaxID=3031331 RepID=UPI0023DAA4B7|nr:putative zinc-binding metallopeptidase [Ramlibacter sp. H39-3-26]MDF1484814.1 putative zinc-binding metallopeptidase [Ramlibacter sp. H39-3-26]